MQKDTLDLIQVLLARQEAVDSINLALIALQKKNEAWAQKKIDELRDEVCTLNAELTVLGQSKSFIEPVAKGKA